MQSESPRDSLTDSPLVSETHTVMYHEIKGKNISFAITAILIKNGTHFFIIKFHHKKYKII
jgi:hypothetical protein